MSPTIAGRPQNASRAGSLRSTDARSTEQAVHPIRQGSAEASHETIQRSEWGPGAGCRKVTRPYCQSLPALHLRYRWVDDEERR